MRVQVRVQKKYFFEFEFGKMIEFEFAAQLSWWYTSSKTHAIKLLALSTYNHARWMSKVLYVMKLAMLKP